MLKIIAHRGASGLAKQENSIEAFKIAMDLNSDMVEFDVRQTRDKKLIVIHDSVYNDVPVEYQLYEKIEKEAEEKSCHIPLLEEVLILCHGKVKMDIEIKETGFEKAVVEMLHKYCDHNEYTVKSFIDKFPYRIKKLDPDITVGLLIGQRHKRLKRRIEDHFPVRRLKACKADFVSPHYSLLSRFFCWKVRGAGFEIYPWTINSEKKMRKYLKRSDGIITDNPDLGIYVRNTMLKMCSFTKKRKK